MRSMITLIKNGLERILNILNNVNISGSDESKYCLCRIKQAENFQILYRRQKDFNND